MKLTRDELQNLRSGLATIRLATETLEADEIPPASVFAVQIIRRNADQLSRLLETKATMETVQICPDA